MPNKWEWLEQRKKQALLEKQQQNMNFAQMPVGARYPTGNGEDGVMQANMPVAKVPTSMGPRMIHEGEEMRKTPNGNVNVVSQRELVEEEKTKNIPGYKSGGVFNPTGDRFGQQPVTMPTGADPLTWKAPDRLKTTTDNTTNTPGVSDSPANSSYTNPNKNSALTAPNKGFGDRPEFNKTPSDIPVTDTPVDDVVDIPTEDNLYESEFKSALGRIGQIDSNQAAYQKAIDDTATRQATEELVGAQRRTQAGVGDVEGRTAGMLQSREHGSELADLEAKGGIEQMRLEEQAAVTKANLAKSGMDFQYGKDFDAFNKQVETGDWEGASATFNATYGTDIDFSEPKFRDAHGSLIASAGNGVGFDVWKSEAIASGAWDDLDMTDSDIEAMYTDYTLQSNPLYKATQQIDQLTISPDNPNGIFTEKQADDMKDLMAYMESNPEGFEQVTGYGVYDENGVEKKMFETSEEATQYLNENPGQGYSMKEDPEGIWKATGSTSGTGSKNTIPDDAWNEMPEQDQYDAFSDTMPDNVDWDLNEWIRNNKPKDYNNWLGENPVEGIGDSILADDGTLDMPIEDYDRIIEGIDQGDKNIVDRYSYPDDLNVIDFILNPEVEFKGRDEMLEQVSDINENKGKILKFPDGTSVVVIEAMALGREGSNTKTMHIRVLNPATGKKETITIN